MNNHSYQSLQRDSMESPGLTEFLPGDPLMNDLSRQYVTDNWLCPSPEQEFRNNIEESMLLGVDSAKYN
ncbi:MAG: hypothetical protein ACRD47_09650 [Nitrososphaeraceae archaeon]